MNDLAELNVIPMWSLLQGASTQSDPQFDAQARSIQPDDLATLIYTSGTTGASKGVMLSHGNLTSCAVMASKQAEWEPGDVYLSFLPLSHVTARPVDYVFYLHCVTIAYCAVFDELPRMLQEAKPTIIVGVPRVYEKVRQEVERRAAFGIKHKILQWAFRVGERHTDEIAHGDHPKSLEWKLADKLVYSKIRQACRGRSPAYLSDGALRGYARAVGVFAAANH